MAVQNDEDTGLAGRVLDISGVGFAFGVVFLLANSLSE